MIGRRCCPVCWRLIGALGLDRQSLAQRNRHLAIARHRPSRKHQLRDQLLKAVAQIPVPMQRGNPQRLLIIRPDHLGDALLSTPAIGLLKRARPDLQIHVLCGPWSAELFSRYPAIDQALALPFPAFARSRSTDNAYLLALRWARRLRETGYCCAIIMRPDHWWGAMLAHLAGIPRRIGYKHANVAPFLTETHALRHEHAVQKSLRLVDPWTGTVLRADIRLEFPLAEADCAYIEGRLAELGIPQGRQLICIHPGSGAASKLWRNDKWAAVADALRRATDCAIVFTGAASESGLIAEILAQMSQSGHSVGETSIGQLAALYEKASLVLGPDSGALHVAAARDTPTIALFGPADPVEFAPWGDPDRHVVLTTGLACAPCRILDWRDDDAAHHPCVRDIEVNEVLAAARRIFLGAADA